MLSFFVYRYIFLLSVFFFFFFSSRRRHTRCLSDWSSDVCSSDLEPSQRRADRRVRKLACAEHHALAAEHPGAAGGALSSQLVEQPALADPRLARSEERRVGKECRSRWSPQP